MWKTHTTYIPTKYIVSFLCLYIYIYFFFIISFSLGFFVIVIVLIKLSELMEEGNIRVVLWENGNVTQFIPNNPTARLNNLWEKFSHLLLHGSLRLYRQNTLKMNCIRKRNVKAKRKVYIRKVSRILIFDMWRVYK